MMFTLHFPLLVRLLLTIYVSVSLAVSFINSPQSVQARIGDNVTFTCDIVNDPYLSRRFIQYQLNGTIAVEITGNEPSTLAKYERLKKYITKSITATLNLTLLLI